MDRNRLKAELVLRGENIEGLAKVLGISKSSAYRKINGESEFSRKEIEEVLSFLGISAEEGCQIFFAQKVS